METLAVHAHLLDLTDGEGVVPPDRWYHELTDGSLTYRFGESPKTFTWDAQAVASIVAGLGGPPSSPQAQLLLERWDDIARLLRMAGRPEPARLLVDHATDEMRLIWDDPHDTLVVGPDPD